MVSSVINFVYESPQNFPNDVKLSILKARKYHGSRKVRWRQSLSASLLSRIKALAIAAKHCRETDIKVFFIPPILLDFFTSLSFIRHSITNSIISDTAWKVSKYGVFLVRIFPHSDWIRRDTEKILRISPYLVQIRENTDQNNPVFGQFSRSVRLLTNSQLFRHSSSQAKVFKTNVKQITVITYIVYWFLILGFSI